jgi:hypothetical protein
MATAMPIFVGVVAVGGAGAGYSIQETMENGLYLTGISGVNLDSMACKNVYCSRANISGKHCTYTFFGKYSCNVGFATTSVGRSNHFFVGNGIIAVDGEYGKVIAMAKVAVNHILL